jgi:large subunit ribosomal protein L22
MEAKAVGRTLKLSTRKARLVADLVRDRRVVDALNILQFTNKKAAPIIKKVVESAIANATNNYGMDADTLYVSQIFVDEGPMMKRVSPRAMGRADIVKKQTSHVTVVVSEKKEG